jgi:hypothetical protein
MCEINVLKLSFVLKKGTSIHLRIWYASLNDVSLSCNDEEEEIKY